MERMKIISVSPGETISVKWDGIRFAIIDSAGLITIVIILNYKEMLDLARFAERQGIRKR